MPDETSRDTRARPSVLVVDDSAPLRSVVVVYLKTVFDAVTEEAANGMEAVARLLTQRFDLVITDLVMPRMNGLELLAFIRRQEKYRGLPVVMLTTRDLDQDRRRAEDLGVDAYLLKPFSPHELGPLCMGWLKTAP